MIRVSVIGV